jgi:PKD repeat protein
MSVATPAHAQVTQVNSSGKAFPSISLPRVARGGEITFVMGARLAEVAQWYGVTQTDLRGVIARDRSLMADLRGYLAYACPKVGQEAATSTGTATASPPPFPLSQTFLLHSRPGATKKIYLDFNGHTTSGTNWNTSFAAGKSIVTPPFDQNSNTAAFSDAELGAIQRIWHAVCEDYAPYEVDVTTEDPGAAGLSRSTNSDTTFGVRVCIGGSSMTWYREPAGGVAYMGSFNWNTDTPCFIFSDELSAVEKYVAEAVSHEVGHSLGLNHDGQTDGNEYYYGHANWAPIMGVGYYADVVQFSKGGYPLANNTQDDLTVMQSYGITRRADDAGDTILNAVPLAGSTFNLSGIISTGLDADLFEFSTGTGTVSFTTASLSSSPNLDAQLAVYDASGTLVTYANAATLSGGLTTDLTAGTYYLAVEGVGSGDALSGYSDYGSLGGYTLSGAVPPAPVNAAPVVVVSATPTSGAAPLTVAFSSAGSYDPDGSIASYSWDFGDGSPLETTADPSHLYKSAGTFIASLVVVDNGGKSSRATKTITVANDTRIYVSSIALTGKTSNTSRTATAVITVMKANGTVASGAKVAVAWSGLYAAKVSGTTNTSGQVTFTTKAVAKPGTFTITVTGVTLSGHTYSSSLNTATSASVTVQ